ncbi:hypothetical protein OG936_14320 [Streptomyces sp. NBC_00846]|uniref:hypothetical protein n=1 Tax=Streptomyces sp. NBC_00846 TaxID=2975849 RepID=UPI00386644CC|nr:hypothetical protein OG936_14320 [Streptomyces sp. NBC_00846]
MSGDLAADALRDVDAAKSLARLRARLTPAWYGPAAAAAVIVPALGEAWTEGRGGWAALLSLPISLAGLAVVLVLANAARRRAGVMVTLPWSVRLRRAAIPLLSLLAAGIVTYALCRQFGADRATTKVVLFAVLGLGVWAVFALRNKSIGKTLAQGSWRTDDHRVRVG